MRHLIRLLAFTLICAPTGWAEAAWTDYFGAHYDAASWAGSLRDPGGPGRFGYWFPSARNDRRLTSPDSGSAEEIRAQVVRGDVVLNVGGVGSGRDPEMVGGFIKGVRADLGATWKRELAERVRRVARIPGAAEHVYWQFGNEINGPRIVENLAKGSGMGGGGGFEGAMAASIQPYVEYFLAPGVEAVRMASREVYGDPLRIHVMLGSLANARHPRSINWYEQLLDYTIKGDYAPSLAGRKVYEIVDSLSIHYLVSSPDDGWSDVLDSLSAKWVGKGGVRRIWATEELGVRRAQGGYGAATAVKVAARYLDWWQRHGWPADRGHCFFWGAEMGRTGTRATDALGLLAEFTGPANLNRVPLQGQEGMETYLFSVDGDRKRVLVVSPRGGLRLGSARFQSLAIPTNGWGGARGRAFVFSANGTEQLSATGQGGSALTIGLDRPVEIPDNATLMILLERG